MKLNGSTAKTIFILMVLLLKNFFMKLNFSAIWVMVALVDNVLLNQE